MEIITLLVFAGRLAADTISLLGTTRLKGGGLFLLFSSRLICSGTFLETADDGPILELAVSVVSCKVVSSLVFEGAGILHCSLSNYLRSMLSSFRSNSSTKLLIISLLILLSLLLLFKATVSFFRSVILSGLCILLLILDLST